MTKQELRAQLIGGTGGRPSKDFCKGRKSTSPFQLDGDERVTEISPTRLPTEDEVMLQCLLLQKLGLSVNSDSFASAKRWINQGLPFWLIAPGSLKVGLDNSDKIHGLQACSTHQGAIYIWHAHQFDCIGWLDGTAVENTG